MTSSQNHVPYAVHPAVAMALDWLRVAYELDG